MDAEARTAAAAAAAQPGGWEAAQIDRAQAWYVSRNSRRLKLLNLAPDPPTGADAHAPETAMLPSRAGLPPHRDEAQVALDVKRSFVMYREMQDPEVRAVRRRQLEAVLCGTLRQYPALHYYQGFHDVASILLVTLCPNLPPESGTWPSTHTRCCVQRAVDCIGLHVVRDSMASNLDPVLGHLKVVRNLMRAADLPFALALERAFAPTQMLVALPWILTLLTHEVDQVQTAQRILDYVLSHGPESILYVCAALLLAQKERLVGEAAAHDGLYLEHLDMAHLHHILARIPALDSEEAQHTLLRHAHTLQETYRLTCPAVRAQTILGSSSVLFTEHPMCSDAQALAYAALPSEALARNITATPRDACVDTQPLPVARVPRVRLLQRLVPFVARKYTAHHAARMLLASSLSLLLGGSVLSVWFAAQLAGPP